MDEERLEDQQPVIQDDTNYEGEETNLVNNSTSNLENLQFIKEVPTQPFTELPEKVPIIRQALIRHLFNFYKFSYGNTQTEEQFLEFFNALLRDNNAIISGGFVLNALNNPESFETLDVDIYVNCRNLVNVNKPLAKLIHGYDLKEYKASDYCLSFLRRNGIRTVQTINTDARFPGKLLNGIDIMAVRNKRSPLDVVQNFDLTICQVWYDGTMVYATHPKHIERKIGILNKSYIPLLLAGNRFLKRRMLKYKFRGYKIFLDPTYKINPEDTDIFHRNRCEKIPHDDSFYKNWLTRVMFQYILKGDYHILDKNKYRDKTTKMMNLDRFQQIQEMYSPIRYLDADKDINLDQPKLNISDGYDSEDYDSSNPETFFPLVEEHVGTTHSRELSGLSSKEKYYHIFTKLYIDTMNPWPKNPFISDEGHLDYEINLYNGYDFEGRKDMRNSYAYNWIFTTNEYKTIGKLLNLVKTKVHRIGTDPLTLDDDVKVFDLHAHKEDEAISKDGLIQYLGSLGRVRQLPIRCYSSECNMSLEPEEIYAIAGKEFYDEFTRYIGRETPDTLLGELTATTDPTLMDIPGYTFGIEAVLQDEKFRSDGWGELNQKVMCPFCLSYIARGLGCAYVHHDNPNVRRHPGCLLKNVVEEIYTKYENASQGRRLEVCIECGRACAGHTHFTLDENPGFEPHRVVGAEGVPDYSKCDGGGRRELIARILAVRRVVREANQDEEHIEVRKRAALAAEAAAKDPVMLSKADTILEKQATTRTANNLNVALNAQVGQQGGIIRHGNKLMCIHGYGPRYKRKLKTRKNKKINIHKLMKLKKSRKTNW